MVIQVQQRSIVHWRLSIHRSHWYTSARSLSIVQSAVRLADLVSLDPFGTVLLRYPDFDSVLVYTFDHSSIALQRSASDCDRFSNFDVLVFASEGRLSSRFYVSSAHFFQIFGNDSAVISFFDSDSASFIKLRVEQKKIIPVNMFDLTSDALSMNKYTSWVPFLILTIVWFLI